MTLTDATCISKKSPVFFLSGVYSLISKRTLHAILRMCNQRQANLSRYWWQRDPNQRTVASISLPWLASVPIYTLDHHTSFLQFRTRADRAKRLNARVFCHCK